MTNISLDNFKRNVSQYRKIIGVLVAIFIFIIISFFISENYRISSVLSGMNIYDGFMEITNTDFSDKEGESFKLADYYVASSFRSVIGKNQRYYFWHDRSTANHHHYDVGFDT